jgi:hypothetical protein
LGGAAGRDGVRLKRHGPGRIGHMGDVINQIVNIFRDLFGWMHDLVPGGFGLLIIPIVALGIVTILAVRSR